MLGFAAGAFGGGATLGFAAGAFGGGATLGLDVGPLEGGATLGLAADPLEGGADGLTAEPRDAERPPCGLEPPPWNPL